MKKITDRLVEKFRSNLINEEKAKQTTDKYVKDITAFKKWLNGESINKDKVLQYKKDNLRPVAQVSFCKKGRKHGCLRP